MAKNPQVPLYKNKAYEVEKQYGLPRGVLVGLIEQESSFDPKATSKGIGALGLTQIVPKSHPNVDAQRLIDDPMYSIEQGGRILAERVKARKGNIALALTDYHSGQGNTNKFLKDPSSGLGPKGREYAPLVLARSLKYGNSIAPEDYRLLLTKFRPATQPERLLKKAGVSDKLDASAIQYAAAEASGFDLPNARNTPFDFNISSGDNVAAQNVNNNFVMPEMAKQEKQESAFDFKLPELDNPDTIDTNVMPQMAGFGQENNAFAQMPQQQEPMFDLSNVRNQVEQAFASSAKLEIPKSFDSYLDSILSSNYG